MFLAMPATSFLVLALYMAPAPLYPTYASLTAPWGPSALGDQRNAAVLMWLVGNLGTMAAMLLSPRPGSGTTTHASAGSSARRRPHGRRRRTGPFPSYSR